MSNQNRVMELARHCYERLEMRAGYGPDGLSDEMYEAAFGEYDGDDASYLLTVEGDVVTFTYYKDGGSAGVSLAASEHDGEDLEKLAAHQVDRVRALAQQASPW